MFVDFFVGNPLARSHLALATIAAVSSVPFIPVALTLAKIRGRTCWPESAPMDTPNLGLPFLMAAQAQKHMTHNEALRALDALVHLAVIDRDATTPPGSPAEGDRYIVAAAGAGAWEGHDLEIAALQDGAWAFFAPLPGWRSWVGDEEVLVVWDGSAWSPVGGGGGSGGDGEFDTVGINATADETNRLAVTSPASLFNHDGAGHQQKINKATLGDSASQLYQTGFSGRAEIGLTGDDDFHVKVSPDGSAWNEAILIDRDTGEVSFPSGVDIDNPGLPAGGTTGQVLAKVSSDDGDVAWSTPGGGGDMLASMYDPGEVEGDAFDMDNMVEGATSKIMTVDERTKLAGIEAAADVTDAANVAAAGALMSGGLGSVTQAYDADLAVIAGLSSTNDDILQRKSGAWTNRTIAQLLADLGLGALYQPIDSDLTAIAALTTTSYGRGLLTLANAAAARAALELGTAAHAATGDFALAAQGALADTAVQPDDAAAFDSVAIGGATADETNRIAITSPASLFNHAGAGHQLKINKDDAGHTASFLFQTSFSGRAEMGTTGDDDFHVKVSPDGSTWHDAILIDKDTGAAEFPSGFSDPVETREQIKIVTLTQTVYDALSPPDADTIYLIEDDD
jgi:hypothetical protein